ncbi:DUF2690 domain-containing protein [Cryobacterium sp. TMT2-10]|uniref:DUF2690 domain-containing protein n=1 Tax=Cryobacterium sp. TMT2-10 TaxID=1259244 RepID=UPI00106C2AE9|nr:DUF2690 domain-containing protein [Cryobacterium sp. TMT2-10]
MTAGVSSANAAPSHHNTGPVSTGCATDARTIRTFGVDATTWVDVRYSPKCGTNWLRFSNNAKTGWLKITSDWNPSVPVEKYVNPGDSVYWSNQVYAPGSTCITVQASIRSGWPGTWNATAPLRIC